MASIRTEKSNGRRSIQFSDADGTRRTIRLGKVTKRDAEAAKRHIEGMLSAQLAGTALDRQTAIWLAEVGDKIHDRLARVGLCEPREAAEVEETAKPAEVPTVTLGPFLADTIAKRTDVKESTVKVWRRCEKRLLQHFGADKPIADITAGDALDFRRWLLKQYPSENTVRRMTGVCRQFFNEALAHKLVEANPFIQRAIPCSVKPNRDRYHFVPRADVTKISAACPDADWRAIVALTRYGGLRCPSEVLSLKWTDINWELGRVLVTSPKTEHHEGGESRLLPLFPELRAVLTENFEQAADGAEFVINRYRDASNANLRTTFLKIIKRAGVKPWPKLFQNLRSTRETELAETFPMHVVCQWIGNSELVAAKHYLQTTDAHFERAADVSTTTAEPASEDASEKAEKVTHFPTQYRAEPDGITSDSASTAHRKPRETRISRGKQAVLVGDEGLEPNPPTNSSETTCDDVPVSSIQTDAFSDAYGADLAEVIERWPMLSIEERRAVLAIVRND